MSTESLPLKFYELSWKYNIFSSKTILSKISIYDTPNICIISFEQSHFILWQDNVPKYTWWRIVEIAIIVKRWCSNMNIRLRTTGSDPCILATGHIYRQDNSEFSNRKSRRIFACNRKGDPWGYPLHSATKDTELPVCDFSSYVLCIFTERYKFEIRIPSKHQRKFIFFTLEKELLNCNLVICYIYWNI